MNTDPKKSAQPCGCDPGCPYVCEQHRDSLQDGGKEWSCSFCGKDALFECKCNTSLRGTMGPIEEQIRKDFNKLANEQVGFAKLAEDNRAAIAGEKVMQQRPELLKRLAAPTRASTFPQDATGRKMTPVGTGVLDYFPDALIAIAQVSHAGNEQHNPGQPLHWNREKSTDESDALIRHFLERGAIDTDGMRHSAKMAWRALALLQKEIEDSK